MLGKIIIFILRQNKSVKKLKIPARKTEFKYKKGKYYLQDRGCFLRGRQIYSLYFENIPNPIAFDNIKEKTGNPNPNNKDNENAELNIDSSVIKDMTEKDFLSSLTETSIEKIDMIYLLIAIISIFLSAGALYYIRQVAVSLGV